MDEIKANEKGIKARTLHLMLTHGDQAGVLDETLLRIEIDGMLYPVSALVRKANVVALRVIVVPKT